MDLSSCNILINDEMKQKKNKTIIWYVEAHWHENKSIFLSNDKLQMNKHCWMT